MKATLVKKQANWYNLYQNDIGIGSTHAELQGHKLSLKNCQAIEKGYDLDELAKTEYPIGEVWNDEDSFIRKRAFQKGFQKAIELMGDKKFNEEDMIHAYIEGTNDGAQFESMMDYDHSDNSEVEELSERAEQDFRKLLQQTEWDVEIVMEYVGECNGNNDNGCFQDSPGHNCGCFERKPKLDENGWLILKRI